MTHVIVGSCESLEKHYTAHLGSNDEMGSCHGDEVLQHHRTPRTGKCNLSSAAAQKQNTSLSCYISTNKSTVFTNVKD